MNFTAENIWSPEVWKWYENLKIVTRVSLDHESSDPEKKLKKVIAVLLKSTIMNKLELEAILQLLQVMERSNSSKIFDKSSVQGPL